MKLSVSTFFLAFLFLAACGRTPENTQTSTVCTPQFAADTNTLGNQFNAASLKITRIERSLKESEKKTIDGMAIKPESGEGLLGAHNRLVRSSLVELLTEYTNIKNFFKAFREKHPGVKCVGHDNNGDKIYFEVDFDVERQIKKMEDVIEHVNGELNKLPREYA